MVSVLFYKPIFAVFALGRIFHKYHSSLEASGRIPFSVLAAVYVCSIRFFVFLVLLGLTRECFILSGFEIAIQQCIIVFDQAAVVVYWHHHMLTYCLFVLHCMYRSVLSYNL